MTRRAGSGSLPSRTMASVSKSRDSLVSEVGNWVSGDRFWGREGDVQELSRLLRDGANVSITAPRRIGKTSLMREVARQLEGEFLAIHVDLQSAMTPEDVVAELAVASREHRDLHRRVLDIFRAKIGAVEQLEYGEIAMRIRSAAATNWQGNADRLLAEFVDNQPPVVVYIDELAILVSRLLHGPELTLTPAGIAAVDQLMSWLRHATIHYTRKIRFVIASSIGLAPVLSRARLSATINTFTRFELPPWDHATTLGALRALANASHIAWAQDAPEAVVERLGVCIPHHVQVFWGHLQLDARRHNVFRITANDVERVFRADMLGSAGHAELSHYEERLAFSLGSQLLPLAIDLLSEAAIAGPLTIPAVQQLAADFTPQQLREVLGTLLHDGYLHLENDVYSFPSSFLREWWKARHSSSHRTLAKRG
ncbi:ATP-binding protein [Nannocystaceae bacterium ST9]